MTTPATSIQEKDPLQGRIIFVLIMTVLVQFMYPISVGDSPLRSIIFQIFYMSLFAAGIYLVRHKRRLFQLLLLASAAWIVVGTIYALRPDLQRANLAGYLLIILFQTVLTLVLLRFIFETRVVDKDVLLAAITVYLLLGAIFVPVFGMIETLTWFPDQTTHAFFDPQNDLAGLASPWQSLVYYSYATLTTLGYGDILPITYWARSAATMEAVIGVLYTAIIMARLVGLYAGREVEEAGTMTNDQSI